MRSKSNFPNQKCKTGEGNIFLWQLKLNGVVFSHQIGWSLASSSVWTQLFDLLPRLANLRHQAQHDTVPCPRRQREPPQLVHHLARRVRIRFVGLFPNRESGLAWTSHVRVCTLARLCHFVRHEPLGKLEAFRTQQLQQPANSPQHSHARRLHSQHTRVYCQDQYLSITPFEAQETSATSPRCCGWK